MKNFVSHPLDSGSQPFPCNLPNQSHLKLSMPVSAKNATAKKPRFEASAAFSESKAWESVGEGWRQLHGSYRERGFSFEWHDFTSQREVDWGQSFHPGSAEICLNLAGRGFVAEGKRKLEFVPMTAGLYWPNNQCLKAARAA